MLPGGCGRNKAGRPGGRYRRALHLGYGDDAVGITDSVSDLIPGKYLIPYFPCSSARYGCSPVYAISGYHNLKKAIAVALHS